MEKEKTLKLDVVKTIKVGFAFAIIQVFWSVYDFVIPLLLENAFGLSNFWRGAIMGLDNLLALFLLPLFGKLSDKSKSKFGRRTPFIVIGTLLAVMFMVFIPVSASAQLKEANAMRDDLEYRLENDVDGLRTTLLGEWYDLAESGEDYSYISKLEYTTMTANTEIDSADAYVAECFLTELKKEKVGGETKFYRGARSSVDADYEFVEISEEEYNELYEHNSFYNKYASGAIANYISKQVHDNITEQNKGRLVVYLAILLLVLISMAVFRSPAVALMPDVTPKPLRSQANAFINLAGGVGSAIAFLIYTIAFKINDNAYVGIYLVTAGCMLGLLICFLLLVKEPKLNEECRKTCEEYGITDEDDEAVALKEMEKEDGVAENVDDKVLEAERQKLKKAKLKSFILILASIFMWFMGYNAVSSNLSVYCVKVLNLKPVVASIISGASMAISAIAFIPVGFLAVKIGRRKSIMLGFLLASISFMLVFAFVRPGNGLGPAIVFAAFYLIAGFGLIIANVNTFPMVVELSSAQDVGKYTGYYYMATMSAQAITPSIAGLFMDNVNNYSLFAYAFVCVIIAIVLMAFVRHGDSRPLPKKNVAEYLPEQD